MDEEQAGSPRYRRRERRRPGATPPPAADPAAPAQAEAEAVYADVRAAGPQATDPAPTPPSAADPAGVEKRKVRARRTDAERGLRGIVGAGASQVGTLGAMRARDAARPTAQDIAAAERDLVIVHRHYVPPEALPGAR